MVLQDGSGRPTAFFGVWENTYFGAYRSVEVHRYDIYNYIDVCFNLLWPKSCLDIINIHIFAYVYRCTIMYIVMIVDGYHALRIHICCTWNHLGTHVFEFLLFELLKTDTVVLVLFWTTPAPLESEEYLLSVCVVTVLFYIIDAVRDLEVKHSKC